MPPVFFVIHHWNMQCKTDTFTLRLMSHYVYAMSHAQKTVENEQKILQWKFVNFFLWKTNIFVIVVVTKNRWKSILFHPRDNRIRERDFINFYDLFKFWRYFMSYPQKSFKMFVFAETALLLMISTAAFASKTLNSATDFVTYHIICV